jgi:hypothetical protein
MVSAINGVYHVNKCQPVLNMPVCQPVCVNVLSTFDFCHILAILTTADLCRLLMMAGMTLYLIIIIIVVMIIEL